MVRTTPKEVAAVFVRTAWMRFFPLSYQMTESRPWSPAGSATRVPRLSREPGTTLALDEPTFHRSMWAHA